MSFLVTCIFPLADVQDATSQSGHARSPPPPFHFYLRTASCTRQNPETGTCSTGQRSSYKRDYVRKPLFSSCARNRPFRRRNPEEGFRSLFFLKEIPLAMKTVPESGTGSVFSMSARDPAVWPRDPEYPPLAPTSPLTTNSAALSTSFLLRRMVCIVPMLRCVYALSTLIMNASVSSAARVLTRRAEVHGRSTLHGGDVFFSKGKALVGRLRATRPQKLKSCLV